MSNSETRQDNRDSMFLLAPLRVEGDDAEHRVKIRNLSSGGAMAVGEVKVARGSMVSLELRNVGWIEGAVAWKQDDRFGISFAEEIDPKLVRSPVTGGVDDRSRPYSQTMPQPSPGALRKI